MKRFALMRKTVGDVRGQIIGFSLTTFLLALLVLWLYPPYRDAFASLDLPPVLRKVMGEEAPVGSFEQFLAQEFFTWVPIVLIVYAIISATGTLAGEEGAGTLDILIAQPVKRHRVVLEKAAGLTLGLTVATLASLPGFLIGAGIAGLGARLGDIFPAVINMLPLVFLFLAFSLWASAALPTRGAAAAVTIGVVVGMYFFNVIGAAVQDVDFLRRLSPFYWADAAHVLMHGFDWARAGGLFSIAGLFLLLALWSFGRREVVSGTREWSLRSIVPSTR